MLEAFRRKTAEEQSARAGSARLQLAAMRRIFDYLRPERDGGKRPPLGLGAREVEGVMAKEQANRDSNSLAEPVRRQRARRERWRREGERPLGHNLAMIGVLGWLVVTPTLIGIFVGRWLDRIAESGIFWTVSLLFAGLCLGCWLAWKRVNQA